MTLAINQLGKQFDGKWVLRDVSIPFERGRVHGLVGHNGSGKSTIIKILAGYHELDAGTVTLDGDVVNLASRTVVHEIGIRFVHQDLGLVADFNAVENFGVGGTYFRNAAGFIDWKTQAARLSAVLAGFGVDVPLDVPVAQLSAVQRALIAIARAVEQRTDDGRQMRFLVLDEPTTALEGPEIAVLFDVVRKLCESGLGVIYVSHNLRDVLTLATDISVLRSGSLVKTFTDRSATYESLLTAMLGETLAKDTQGIEQASDATAFAASVADRVPRLSIRGLRSDSLRGVDIDVYPGDCIFVLGLSGSGREEFVYAVAGSAPVTTVSLAIEGTPVKEISPRTWEKQRIALIPGNRKPGSSIPDFTVSENISLVSLKRHSAWPGRVSRKSERAAVATWAERLDITPSDPNYMMRNLSGGNKQKVILAKWLESNPQILLIDEPTAGVDVAAAHKLLSELRALAREGRALIVSTSEAGDALAAADRVLILNEGGITDELVRGRDVLNEETIMRAMNQNVAGVKL